MFCNSLAAKSALRLGKRESIKSVGVSFKAFDGFESRPINFPDLFTDKKTKKKYYKTAEIWRYKQYLGSWGNSNGVLTVAEMSFIPPKSSLIYITDKQATKKFRVKEQSVYWGKGKKLEWLESFIGREIKSKPVVSRRRDGTAIEYYPLKDNKSYYGLFIVSNSRVLKNNIVFLYKIEARVSKKKVMKLIYSSIKSVYFAYVRKKNNKSLAKSSSEYEVSKEKVLRNIRNLRDWWGIDAKDYFIITNYPKSSKPFIKEIETELKLSQKIYSRFYKRTVPLKEVNVVRIFKDRDDYAAYVGEGHGWTAGMWMPSKEELVISPLIHGKGSKNESSQIRILKHEAFHQYIHYALDQVQTSAWFNEGNAVFFEGTRISGKKLKVDPSNYLNLLKQMVKKQKPDINALLNMSYAQFYSGGKKSIAEHYALAWGVVYFVYKGAPKIKRRTGRDYTKILKNYYKRLIATKSREEATKSAWSRVNMKQFTADFVKYYKNL